MKKNRTQRDEEKASSVLTEKTVFGRTAPTTLRHLQNVIKGPALSSQETTENKRGALWDEGQTPYSSFQGIRVKYLFNNEYSVD